MIAVCSQSRLGQHCLITINDVRYTNLYTNCDTATTMADIIKCAYCGRDCQRVTHIRNPFRFQVFLENKQHSVGATAVPRMKVNKKTPFCTRSDCIISVWHAYARKPRSSTLQAYRSERKTQTEVQRCIKKRTRPDFDRYPTSLQAVKCLLDCCDHLGSAGVIPALNTMRCLVDPCGSRDDNIITTTLSRFASGAVAFANDINPEVQADFGVDLRSPEFSLQLKAAITHTIDCVITSPPYKLYECALLNSLSIGSQIIAFKLCLSFLEPAERYAVLHEPQGAQLAAVIVMPRDYEGSGVNTRHFTDCWFIWKRCPPEATQPTIIGFAWDNKTSWDAQSQVDYHSVTSSVHAIAVEIESLPASIACASALYTGLFPRHRHGIVYVSEAILGQVLQAADPELVVIFGDATCDTSECKDIDWIICTPRRKEIDSTYAKAMKKALKGVALRVALYWLEPSKRHSSLLFTHFLSDVIIMSRDVVTDRVDAQRGRYATDVWLIWDKSKSQCAPRLLFASK